MLSTATAALSPRHAAKLDEAHAIVAAIGCPSCSGAPIGKPCRDAGRLLGQGACLQRKRAYAAATAPKPQRDPAEDYYLSYAVTAAPAQAPRVRLAPVVQPPTIEQAISAAFAKADPLPAPTTAIAPTLVLGKHATTTSAPSAPATTSTTKGSAMNPIEKMLAENRDLIGAPGATREAEQQRAKTLKRILAENERAARPMPSTPAEWIIAETAARLAPDTIDAAFLAATQKQREAAHLAQIDDAIRAWDSAFAKNMARSQTAPSK